MGSNQHHSAYFKIFPCVWSHTLRTNLGTPTFYALNLMVGLLQTIFESFKNF